MCIQCLVTHTQALGFVDMKTTSKKLIYNLKQRMCRHAVAFCKIILEAEFYILAVISRLESFCKLY